MSTSQPRTGCVALRVRIGWVRILLFTAILAGVFAMHTGGRTEGGSAEAIAVRPQHSDGHVHQAVHGAHTIYSGGARTPAAHVPTTHAIRLEAVAVAVAPAAAGAAASGGAGGHSKHDFSCELTSMCLGLLAGAAVALVLSRARGTRPRRCPTAGASGWPAQATAPPRPPSLAALSVSRT
jgi:hypothetical protein